MENKTYILQPEKKFLKQGYFLADENDKVIYEAKVLKQPLFGAMQVKFINHLTNKEEDHKLGKTVTVTESGIIGSFATKSEFKFDGTKIWDYLHDLGIRIDSSIQSGKLGMTYDVTLKGKEMATISTSTPKGKSIITTNRCLNVVTSEENLDLAFLVAYSIARTEQLTYD